MDNEVSGTVIGSVVQVGTLTGSVHINGAGAGHTVVPRQLPACPSIFVNRSTELAAITNALESDHVDTAVPVSVITGLGGVGKTSLALRWAHQQVDLFRDGQLYVDLRGFAGDQPLSAGQALRGFLWALGVRDDDHPVGVDAQAATYRSLLAGKRMLVLVDNARDTKDVAPLLPGSSGCAVVVTSRHSLGGMVTRGAQIVALDTLPDDQAMEVFARHVGRARMDAEPEAVMELLHACAGLPLAVNIMAARVVMQPNSTLAQLAAELQDESERLDGIDTGEVRGSLREVLSWSYQALDPDTARVFRLLGAASGPDIGLESVAILTDQPRPTARRLLHKLETAHLVRQHTHNRYQMHDLVRLYAASLDIEDADHAVRRLVEFLVGTSHRGARTLAPHRPQIEQALTEVAAKADHAGRFPNALAAMAWFDAEYHCLLEAQRLALRRGWYAQAWQFAWGLAGFQGRRGHARDGMISWQNALAAAHHLGDASVSAVTERHLGYACLATGDNDSAIEHMTRAVALADETDVMSSRIGAHRALAHARDQRGDSEQALISINHALDLCRNTDLAGWEAEMRCQAANYHGRLGDHDTMRAHCEAVIATYGDHRNPEAVGIAMRSLGSLATDHGRHLEAADHYRQAAVLFADIGNNYDEADALNLLGDSQHAAGNESDAHDTWQRALHLARTQHRPALIAQIEAKPGQEAHSGRNPLDEPDLNTPTS